MKEKSNLGIIEILNILALRKKMIFWVTLIMSIAIVIFSLVVTQKWTSTVVVQPLTSSSSLNLGGLGSSLISSLAGGLSGSSESEGQRLIAIINSRPFLEKFIDEFDLSTYFKLKKKTDDVHRIRDATIKKIKQDMLSVSYNPETGFLTVSVESKDRELSPKMANYIVEELDRYNKYDRVTKAKESRITLENRLIQINNDIDSLLVKMKTFQQKNNVLDITEQTKSLVNEYVKLESERVKREISYDIIKSSMSDNDPRLESLQDEIASINNAIGKLEGTKKAGNNKYIIALDNIPEILQEYLPMQANVEVYKKVYEFIYPQLELAKLEESRQTTTLNTIEEAVPAGLRTFPRRGMLCITVFFITVVSISVYAIFLHKAQEFFAIEENKNKILELRKNLLGK